MENLPPGFRQSAELQGFMNMLFPGEVYCARSGMKYGPLLSARAERKSNAWELEIAGCLARTPDNRENAKKRTALDMSGDKQLDTSPNASQSLDRMSAEPSNRRLLKLWRLENDVSRQDAQFARLRDQMRAADEGEEYAPKHSTTVVRGYEYMIAQEGLPSQEKQKDVARRQQQCSEKRVQLPRASVRMGAEDSEIATIPPESDETPQYSR